MASAVPAAGPAGPRTASVTAVVELACPSARGAGQTSAVDATGTGVGARRRPAPRSASSPPGPDDGQRAPAHASGGDAPRRPGDRAVSRGTRAGRGHGGRGGLRRSTRAGSWQPSSSSSSRPRAGAGPGSARSTTTATASQLQPQRACCGRGPRTDTPTRGGVGRRRWPTGDLRRGPSAHRTAHRAVPSPARATQPGSAACASTNRPGARRRRHRRGLQAQPRAVGRAATVGGGACGPRGAAGDGAGARRPPADPPQRGAGVAGRPGAARPARRARAAQPVVARRRALQQHVPASPSARATFDLVAADTGDERADRGGDTRRRGRGDVAVTEPWRGGVQQLVADVAADACRSMRARGRVGEARSAATNAGTCRGSSRRSGPSTPRSTRRARRPVGRASPRRAAPPPAAASRSSSRPTLCADPVGRDGGGGEHRATREQRRRPGPGPDRPTTPSTVDPGGELHQARAPARRAPRARRRAPPADRSRRSTRGERREHERRGPPQRGGTGPARVQQHQVEPVQPPVGRPGQARARAAAARGRAAAAAARARAAAPASRPRRAAGSRGRRATHRAAAPREARTSATNHSAGTKARRPPAAARCPRPAARSAGRPDPEQPGTHERASGGSSTATTQVPSRPPATAPVTAGSSAYATRRPAPHQPRGHEPAQRQVRGQAGERDSEQQHHVDRERGLPAQHRGRQREQREPRRRVGGRAEAHVVPGRPGSRRPGRRRRAGRPAGRRRRSCAGTEQGAYREHRGDEQRRAVSSDPGPGQPAAHPGGARGGSRGPVVLVRLGSAGTGRVGAAAASEHADGPLPERAGLPGAGGQQRAHLTVGHRIPARRPARGPARERCSDAGSAQRCRRRHRARRAPRAGSCPAGSRRRAAASRHAAAGARTATRAVPAWASSRCSAAARSRRAAEGLARRPRRRPRGARARRLTVVHDGVAGDDHPVPARRARQHRSTSSRNSGRPGSKPPSASHTSRRTSMPGAADGEHVARRRRAGPGPARAAPAR